MSSDDSDRKTDHDAILARRAVFLSSALAALSCAPSPPKTDGPSTVNVPPPSAVTSHPAPPGNEDVNREPPKVAHRSWEQAMALAPPLQVSAKTSATEQEMLSQLRKQVETSYAAIRAIWDANPGCDAAKPDCRDGWRALGSKLKAAHDSIRSLGPGLCGGWGSNPPAANQRRENHQAFLGELLNEAVEHKRATASSYSQIGEQEWLKIAANSAQPPPMPCLSCLPPRVHAIGGVIGFAQDSATIDVKDANVSASLERLKESLAQQPTVQVRLRGHADPSERDVDKLAMERAKALIAWLKSNGVDAKRFQPISLAAEVPVANSASAGGAAQNRRVDLEVAPPKTP